MGVVQSGLRAASLAGALALSLLACGGEDPGAPARSGDPSAPGGVAAATGSAALPKVVFLGDSLTAGLSLEVEEAFPARLADLLAAAGSTAGGLARIDWVLQQQPDIVVVELGVNDGLRGIPPAATEANLREVLERVDEAGAQALLLGMRLPPNYGFIYVRSFEAIYPRLAKDLDVPYVPFFLDGVAGVPELNLADGIHPNAAGQARAAENVLPHLQRLLATR
jgi:acyl-CoA thioesterase-1